MDTKKRRIGITDILLLLIGVVFLIGMCTAFKPCGPMEDGSWMTCHWAGNAVAGVAAVLLAAAVLHLLAGDGKVKTGISAAIIPAAILSAVIPGHLIGLCMMDDMRCHAVTQPAALVFSILMIIVAVVDIILRQRQK